MKRIYLVFLIIVWTKILPCTCYSPTPEEALGKYPVVFLGRLISTTIDSNFLAPTEFGLQRIKYWTFDVIKYVKGLEPRHSRISVISGGTNCDYPFDFYKLGSEFIIYARHLNQYGHLNILTTNQCSQTKLTSDINNEFELKFFKDPGYWKIPEPLDPRYISYGPIKETAQISLRTSWLLLTLIMLNIGLTLFIVFRKK